MDESKYLQKKLKEYPETLPGLDEALSYPEKTATKKIRRNLFEASFRIDDTLVECGIHRHNFFAYFKYRNGCTPKQYILYHRTETAKQLLVDEKLEEVTMSEFSFALGFSGPPAFTRCFKRRIGMTPIEWKERKKENT